MTESLTPSRLRADLYRILDGVLDSGKPVVVKRKGRHIRIMAEPPGKLQALRPHPRYLNDGDEDALDADWSTQWGP